jgi:hypothetical protein
VKKGKQFYSVHTDHQDLKFAIKMASCVMLNVASFVKMLGNSSNMKIISSTIFGAVMLVLLMICIK